MHASIADVIADVVQNAIEAGATLIELSVVTTPQKVEIAVTDNGKGMDEPQLKRALDPFYSEPGKHDRRRVGLGLPFLCQMTGQTGGETRITSTPGKGTRVAFWCDCKHPDTPPLGNLPLTFVALMAYPGHFDLSLRRSDNGRSYAVSREELKEALGDLEQAGNIVLARRFFESQEESLHE